VSRNIITALDVGTSTVQTVVAEKNRENEKLNIMGIGMSPSLGIRRGVVVDLDDAIVSIRKSIEEAQKSAGTQIKSVWLSVGGSHISVSSSRGVVAVSRADGEISPEDVRRAINAAETFIPKNPNKEILHMIPRDFRVDNEPGIKNPIGMHGVRLEVDTLIVECSASFLKNLFKCVEGSGLHVKDYIFSPFAASEAVLTKRQKELGVMLLDLGGGTASFMIFEEGVPIHAGVFPIGGSHITNDVAIGFRTHVDVAERIKLAYSSCLPGDFTKKDNIHLADFIEGETISFTRKELAEIVSARLGDVFELLQKELKKTGRSQLLPSGVVLVGGSSLIPGMVEMTKNEIRLPVELGVPQDFVGSMDEKYFPFLASSLGVLKWAGSQRAGMEFLNHRSSSSSEQSPVIKWLKSLLP